MKRYRQFRILHVAVFTLAVAIACTWKRDFKPKVTYLDASSGMQLADDGRAYPCVRFTFRNDGHLPIWYSRSTISWLTPGCGVSISQYPTPETATNIWMRPDDERPWVRINPGELATINAPVESGTMEMRIAVEVMDWRGRTAECPSESVDPAEIIATEIVVSPE